MQPTTPDSADAVGPTAGRFRRLIRLALRPQAVLGWVAASRRRLVLAGTAVLVLAGTAGLVAILPAPPPTEPIVTLPAALAALDRGDYAEAKGLAERLRQQGGLATEEWGGPSFILGILAVHEAQTTPDRLKTAAYRAAAEHLQDAYDRGFPAGREAAGLYWLGESLYLSGRISASRPLLQAALKANPSHRAEIHRRLADVSLNETPPALDKALAENEQLLAVGELSPAERSEGLLQRAQIFFRLERFSECGNILNKMPARSGTAGEVAVLRGRMLYREAQSLAAAGDSDENRRKAREKYQAAIEALRLAQQRDTVSNHATRQAMLLTALCLLDQGERPAALALLGRTSKLFAGTAEGTAAAFHEAEQSRRLGNDKAALAAYRLLLAAISESPEFHNPWISVKQVQTAAEAACREYVAAGKYESALAIGRLLAPPVVSQVRALETRAQVYQTWGQSLLNQAAGQGADRAEALRRQGRQQFRAAGGVYAQLARLEVTSRLYPEQVWKAAAAYSQGQDYQGAVRMLKIYLSNESRKRHAQGLVELGETLLALGECPEALEALGRCIEQHPRDARAYRARLLAARAAATQGDFQRAESLLRENLSGNSLTPASKEWRDSLFALGQLLGEEGRPVEAMRRLEEAVARYPDAAQATEARYLIARAACRSAEALGANAEGSVPALRAAAARRFWEQALDQYRTVRDALGRRDPRDLLPDEKTMLRNCRFALGEVYAALERYDEAVAAYTDAADRYADRPEVLQAYVELAKVYRRLDRTVEARTSIAQARVALARIPSNARFDETTNYDRKQWNNVLDWMGSL